MANYLITGGTGLIGCALIEQLKKSPASIYVLTRNKKRAVQQFGFSVNLVESLSDIAPQVNIDFIINLAGEPIADKRWSTRQKLEIWQSRVELTNRLVKWIKHRELKPKVLLSGSAVGWYGDGKDRVLTESSSPHNEFTHQLCQAWEDAALAAEEFNVRVCLLRTGLVISPAGGFLSKMLLPFKFGLGARLGNGQQYMPWVHIDDYINAVLLLLDPREEDTDLCHGPFNLASPNPVTNKVFSQTLAKVLSKPCFLFIPAWCLNLALGEMARLVLTGQNAVPDKLQQLGFQFQFNHLQKALQNVLKQPDSKGKN